MTTPTPAAGLAPPSHDHARHARHELAALRADPAVPTGLPAPGAPVDQGDAPGPCQPETVTAAEPGGCQGCGGKYTGLPDDVRAALDDNQTRAFFGVGIALGFGLLGCLLGAWAVWQIRAGQGESA